jgi:hypothetical protein
MHASTISRRARLVAATGLTVAIAASAAAFADAAPAHPPFDPADVAVTPLQEYEGSGTRGRVVLTRAGAGTRVVIAVTGLRPGTRAHVRLHAGRTSSAVFASFVALPGLRAGKGGAARATGEIRFQGRDPVELEDVADGGHVIVVTVGTRILASGVIPNVR